MVSGPCINIDQLCAPVSDGQAAGPYWRDDDECLELFPRVQTAHNDARYNHRKKAQAALFPEDSIERSNFEDPDWGEVVDTGIKLLAKSKDLWVAAWLIEALAYEHGFVGLRDGFRLTRQLCEKYWDSVHPRPDDVDGIRNTLAKLDGDVIGGLIPLMPITSNGATTAEYDQSTEMEGLDSESERDSYRSRGVISTVEFEARVRDSGREFLQDLLEDAKAANDDFVVLSELLDERCGHDAPASSKVKELFQQTIELMEHLALPYLPDVDDGDRDNGLETNDITVIESGSQVSGWDRGQAFSKISQLAELFKKHEPTSPVAWMLGRAVQLGNLAWPDLIDALAEDAAAARQILKQSGVPNKAEGDVDD